MRGARLELALAGPPGLPAQGPIAVWRPRQGDDLSALPKARVVVLTGFRADHDAFAAQGYAVAPQPPYAAGLVCLPRSRALARALVAQAMAETRPEGWLIVDGQKTDGIDAFLKELRAAGLVVGDSLAKAHGKLAFLPAGQAVPAAWAARPQALADGLVTTAGVFSADGPDPGSVLLARHLPPALPARVADLGAGWGFLTREILARAGVRHVDAVEAEALALDCARAAIADARVQWHWADATAFRPAQPWGAVVMNPPFHQTRAAEPELGLAFLRAAHRDLAPDGALWLVANRPLPYEAELARLFRQVDPLAVEGGYKVIRAQGPRRAPIAGAEGRRRYSG